MGLEWKSGISRIFFFYGQLFNKTILYNSMTQNLKSYAFAHSIIGFGSQKIESHNLLSVSFIQGGPSPG